MGLANRAVVHYLREAGRSRDLKLKIVVDIGAVATLVGKHCPAAEVAVDATAKSRVYLAYISRYLR